MIDLDEIERSDGVTILNEIGKDVSVHKKDGSSITIKAIFENGSKQTTEDGFVVHTQDKTLTYWEDINIEEVSHFVVGGKSYKVVNTDSSWVDYLGKAKTVQLI